jgi:tetratricopeptide (TPR) repeat protein
MNSGPDDVSAYYEKGERFHRFGELDAAEAAIRKALAIDDRHAKSWNLLGQVKLAKHQHDQARESFAKAIEYAPDWIQPIEHLGMMEFSLEDYPATVKVLKKYMSLGGRELDILLTLAEAAFLSNDCKTVMSTTALIIEINDDMHEAWEMRGICQAKSEKYAAACISLNVAIELHPASVRALNSVGDLCYDSANYIRAAEFYAISLGVDPVQQEQLFRHGTSLWFLDRWEEAIQFLKKYTELRPDDPKGWNNLGVALREKGEVKRAIECYKRALDIDPTLEVVQKNMMTAKDMQAIP